MTEDDLSAASANTPPGPARHDVRLLYPFWIEPGNLDKAVRALSLLHHTSPSRELKTWQEAARVHELYREDILPLVAQVLFGIRSGANRYLRVDSETVNHWFPQGGVFEPSATAARPGYSLSSAGEGIELFLTPHGVGVLALTFECAEPGPLESLQTLNYQLSQLRGQAGYRYRIPQDPSSALPPPGVDDPLEQRLGAQGGAFRFKELVDFLLAPLNAFGLQETQQQFSVYSVARFDPRTLFTSADGQARFRPFLAALAHVEDAGHPGSLELRERMLNPKHWAAVSSLGAAHLVADHEPGPPRSLYTYFAPYLCALLQRLTLQRLLWETDSAALETDNNLHERQAKLRMLHQDMLRFSVQGRFTEISSREVHNQYYELALEGLRVPATTRLVQGVLRDMESDTTAAFQQETARKGRELAREAKANGAAMTETRRGRRWLDVFFVMIYAMVLTHYVSDFFATPYAFWSLITTPFLSGLIALLCVKPHHPGSDKKPAAPANQGPWACLGILSLIFLAWAVVGWLYFPLEPNGGEDSSVICASEADCQPGANQGTI